MLTVAEEVISRKIRKLSVLTFELEKRLFVQTQIISDEIVDKIISSDEILLSFCELSQKYVEKRDGLEQFLYGSRLRGERENEVEEIVKRNLENWYQKEIKKIGIGDIADFLCKKIEAKHLRFIIAEKMHLILCCNWLDEGGGFEKNFKMEQEMNQFGFGDFYERSCYSDGDSYYGPREDIFIKIRKQIVEKFQTTLKNQSLVKNYLHLPARISRLRKGAEELEAKWKEAGEKNHGQDLIRKHGYDLEEIEKRFPWLVKELNDLYLLSDLKIKNEIIVVVSTGQYTHRGSGVEYVTILTVFRGDQNKKATKYLKYRDAYSKEHDDPSNYFEKCSIEKIGDDSVCVVLSDNQRKRAVTLLV